MQSGPCVPLDGRILQQSLLVCCNQLHNYDCPLCLHIMLCLVLHTGCGLSLTRPIKIIVMSGLVCCRPEFAITQRCWSAAQMSSIHPDVCLICVISYKTPIHKHLQRCVKGNSVLSVIYGHFLLSLLADLFHKLDSKLYSRLSITGHNFAAGVRHVSRPSAGGKHHIAGIADKIGQVSEK